jgi:hypothetical protein
VTSAAVNRIIEHSFVDETADELNRPELIANFGRTGAGAAGSTIVDVKFTATAAMVLLALALGGCSERRDPVMVALVSLEKAAEARDADAFEAWISADYRDPSGLTRPEAVQMVRRYFAGYQQLELVLTRIETERSDAGGTARFRADMIGVPRQFGGLDSILPRASSWEFEVRFAPEDGRWKVYWASWRRLDG